MSKLPPKQLLFVKYYVVSKNATDAARKAGYSKKTAHSQGPRLLENVGVAAQIKKIFDAQTKKLEDEFALENITKERMIRELSITALSDLKDFVKYEDGKFRVVSTDDLGERSKALRKCKSVDTLHGGSVEVELHSKLDAIEKICKLMGWIKDKVEHSGPDGKPMQFSNLTEEELVSRLALLRAIDGKPNGS